MNRDPNNSPQKNEKHLGVKMFLVGVILLGSAAFGILTVFIVLGLKEEDRMPFGDEIPHYVFTNFAIETYIAQTSTAIAAQTASPLPGPSLAPAPNQDTQQTTEDEGYISNQENSE